MTDVYRMPPHNGSRPGGKRRDTFYLGMAILLAVIFIKNVFSVPIPVAVILGIAGLVALHGKQDEIIALAVCCIPMAAAFQYKYLLFICILIYTLKYKNDVRFNRRLFPLFLMLFWELLHGVGSDFSIYEYFRNFAELVFCGFLMVLKGKKYDYPMICRMLAISSVCILSIVLINQLVSSGFQLQMIFTGSYRLGIGNEAVQDFGVNFNANTLGFICNLAATGLLQLIILKKHTKADYVLLAALILFGVMSMSRTFLVCLALIIVLFISAGRTGRRKKRKRILTALLAVALLIAVVYIFMPVVFENFVNRFLEDDVTNGRLELFAFYHEHIISKLRYTFFGIGQQNVARKIYNIYGYVENVSHNGIQELVVCWGIPGLMLFCWFLYEMISGRKHGRRQGILPYIPLILILVNVQAGQMITNGFVLLAFSFACLSLEWNPEKEKLKKEKQTHEEPASHHPVSEGTPEDPPVSEPV